MTVTSETGFYKVDSGWGSEQASLTRAVGLDRLRHSHTKKSHLAISSHPEPRAIRENCSALQERFSRLVPPRGSGGWRWAVKHTGRRESQRRFAVRIPQARPSRDRNAPPGWAHAPEGAVRGRRSRHRFPSTVRRFQERWICAASHRTTARALGLRSE